MSLLLLTAIDYATENAWYARQETERRAQEYITGSLGSREIDNDDDFNVDDLEIPVTTLPSPENDEPDEDPSTSTAPMGEPDPRMFSPRAVPVSSIREFYPRKRGRKGTRIVFLNGAAVLVKEEFETVVAKFESATTR